MSDTKTCSKCGETKPLSEFRSLQGGQKRAKCRTCEREANNAWRRDNPDRARERDAKSREKHRAKRVTKSRQYSEKNKEAERLRSTKYNEEHREERRAYARLRSQQLRADDPEYGKKRYAKNREQELERAARRRSVPHIRLHASMSRAMAHSIRNGGKSGESWLSYVDYTRDELMHHLESKFQPGMAWDNYGASGWEIDHIIPKSLFNFSSPNDIDFKRCWALQNLQPLWKSDNRKKYNHYHKPFQPSLAISAPANDNSQQEVAA